jgi:hypothetical protein
MTRNEAIVALTTITHLNNEELEGFFACSDQERALLVKAYKDAGTVPDKSTWDEVIEVIKTCSELAGYAVPILNVVQLIFSLVEA